jgi:hypothetical protein
MLIPLAVAAGVLRGMRNRPQRPYLKVSKLLPERPVAMITLRQRMAKAELEKELSGGHSARDRYTAA